MPIPSRPTVAIVGATGAVGKEMLDILAHRSFPCARVRGFSSARSAGTTVRLADDPITVEELKDGWHEGIDVALFSAGGSISKRFARDAAKAGTVIIDNSSAFRMDSDVPLVVPEINPHHLDGHANLIANPNCSTIIMMMAVHPIRERYGVERIHVSTYQAASGAGAAAMEELSTQSRIVLDGGDAEPSIFREPCAFNVFSHDSGMDPQTGRNMEEQKMIDESRKIWGDPGLRVNATCVRVPVLRAHAESINLTLSERASLDEVLDALSDAPGVRLLDDRANNDFPTPLKASGGDDTLVGRVRIDESQPEGFGFDLFVASDQLRKGAALNAVQIAELLLP